MNYSSPVDIEFDWHITDACNFNCIYCYPGISMRKNTPFPRPINIGMVLKSFDSIGLSANIIMSGGEPFLFPNFIDLCKGLVKKHHIGLNTNLSSSLVEKFAREIDPRKVSYIWASVHLDERKKIINGMEKFFENFRLLESKGFNIIAIYVLHPSKEDEAEKEIDYIKKMGINRLYVKSYKGIYNSNNYPESYSDKLKRIIINNSGGYTQNIKYLSGERNFSGRMCNAGKTFYKINVDGSVQRCASDPTSCGNIFDGSFVPANAKQKCKIKNVLSLTQCMRFVD